MAPLENPRYHGIELEALPAVMGTICRNVAFLLCLYIYVYVMLNLQNHEKSL